MTVAQIGDVLGISGTTVYRAARRVSEPVSSRRDSLPASSLNEWHGDVLDVRFFCQDVVAITRVSRSMRSK